VGLIVTRRMDISARPVACQGVPGPNGVAVGWLVVAIEDVDKLHEEISPKKMPIQVIKVAAIFKINYPQ
jgi:hypothetical protein